MGATTLLARSSVRGRRRSHLAIALLLTIGIGAAIASFTAAWRTDHAFTDYVRRADVNQLVINPLLITDRLLDVVRSTPGVERMSMSRLLNVDTDDIDPVKLAEFGRYTQVLGSVGGRYIDVDRPTVVDGRMLSGTNEIFLNRNAADAYDLRVGDELSVAFLPTQPNGPLATADPAPIGHERVRVVGIGVFADEVLPDDLYSNVKIIVDPQLTAKYSCVAKHPEPEDTRSIDELAVIFFPPDCSSDASFLSLRLAAGESGVDDVLAHIDARVVTENARLPSAMREKNFGFQVIPTITAVESERIRRSLEPVVLALRLFGLAILAATVVLSAAAAHRTIRDADADLQIWNQLGVARPQRILAVGTPTAVTIVGGLAGALGVGWLGSGIGPVASVKVLDPAPRLGIPAVVVLAVVPGVLVVLLACLVASAWTASAGSPRRASPVGTSRLADAAAKTGDVPLALGVRAALRGRGRSGSGVLIGGSVVAFAVGTGALVYGTNLDGLVSHPVRYGWTFDIGATVNSGYDGADPAQIGSSLDRPGVAGWGVAATALTAVINGVKLPAIADVRGLVDLDVPVLSGELPRGDHEVAIGASSARRLGVKLGDRLMIGTDFGERDAIVTAIVVLPAIGAFLSDRAGLGTGVLLSAPYFQAVVGATEVARNVPPGTFFDTIGGFVAVDLRDGVTAKQFVQELGDEVDTWDVFRRPPTVHIDPVRPAQIADLAAIKSAPLLLAGLTALTMIIGLVAGLGRAIRIRRHELAVLRALGCRSSQLGATLFWQAVTVVVISLGVGVPLGSVAGSTVWRRFASGLGVMATPTVPWGWLAAVVGSGIVVSFAAALASGRRAAAVIPAAALREA